MQGEPTPVILGAVVFIYASAMEIIDSESKIVGAEDVINVSVCVMVATYCLRYRSAGKIICTYT